MSFICELHSHPAFRPLSDEESDQTWAAIKHECTAKDLSALLGWLWAEVDALKREHDPRARQVAMALGRGIDVRTRNEDGVHTHTATLLCRESLRLIRYCSCGYDESIMFLINNLSLIVLQQQSNPSGVPS